MSVDWLAQNLAENMDRLFSIKALEENGTVGFQYPLPYPVWTFFAIMANDNGMLQTLEEGITKHSWGAHLNYGCVAKVCRALNKRFHEDPLYGVNDNVKWEGKRNTRDWIMEYVDIILELGLALEDSDSVIIDFHTNKPCDCKLCDGYMPPPSDPVTGKEMVKKQSDFKDTWSKL